MYTVIWTMHGKELRSEGLSELQARQLALYLAMSGIYPRIIEH